jgi:hypothetical protein
MNTQNNSKSWTEVEIMRLRKLISENTPTRIIALKLDRTEGAVRSKVRQLGLSLKPVNQSPYG